MSSKLHQTFDYLLRVQADGPVGQRRRRLLAVFLVFGIVFAALLVAINIVELATRPQSSQSYVLADGLLILVFIGLWRLNRSGRTNLAAFIFLAICIVGPSLAFSTELLDRFAVIYAMPVMAGSFLLSPGTGTGIAILVTVGYALIHVLNQTSPNFDLFGLGVLWITALASTVIARQLDQALAAAQQSDAQLRADIARREQIETQLHALNQQLEEHVAERTQALAKANVALQEDLAERERTQAMLRAAERRYRALFDQSHDAVFILDFEGNHLETNRRAGEMLGYTVEEIQRLSFKQVSAELPDSQAIMQRLLSGEDILPYERQFRSKSGNLVPVEINVELVRDVAGKPLHIQSIARDITERKQAEEDTRRALATEKELNELKSRFVANTSHEFRTPLATILLSAEILEHYGDRFTPEKRVRYLGQIQSSAKHMVQLMEDVLTLGKAEAGRLLSQPAPIDLPQFCRNLIEEFSMTTADNRAISLEISGDCASACLDEKLLRSILVNLLSNAIKYSPNDQAVACALDCHDGQAIFTVRDHGVGILAELQPRIYEAFQRGANVGNIPGTGLGMSIVKRSVDALGGAIQFTSRPGEGTTFVVGLPLTPVAAAPSGAPASG